MAVEHWQLRVTGLVQGVGYRQWVIRTAAELGLDCRVCNEADGSVRIVAEGGTAALAQLQARCAKGPPLARVIDVHRATGAVEGIKGTIIER